ncbi:complement C1q 4 [Labeo rohita]|uniref:Complement C1q 4 n=1 Tax=Labeo rohita TaxID=84645 RepID=A0A498M133_LABRO|nr:complement C1q 4 [Labeo rohita]
MCKTPFATMPLDSLASPVPMGKGAFGRSSDRSPSPVQSSAVSEGTFTAPHAGLYSFSFTAYSSVGSAGQRLYQKVQLMKNGQLIASSWEDNREDSEDSSTQTVLLQLRRGCQVYVELLSGRQLCGDTKGQNTFSGYLVYPFSDK